MIDALTATDDLAAPRRKAAIVLGAGLLGLVVAYALLDQPIAIAAHALHRPQWCVWLTWIADVPGPAAVLGLAAGGVAWLAGWKPGPWGRVLLAACVATLAASAAKDVLKFAFGRPWPETWVNNNPSWIGTHTYGLFPFHGGAGWASFPSGHTTLITAPCAALWSVRRLRPLLAALPVLVVVGLLGCDFHFLSDCLAGGLLGVAMGVAVIPRPGLLTLQARPMADA